MELDDKQVLFVVDKFYVKEVTIYRNKRFVDEFDGFGNLGEFLTYLRDDGVIIVDGTFDNEETIFINLTLIKEAKEFVEETYPHLLVMKLLTIQGVMQNTALMSEVKRLLSKVSIEQLPELFASRNVQIREYARKRLNAAGIEVDVEDLKETPIVPLRERRQR